VFFRKQDDLDNSLQKQLAQRLGELSGKPRTSKLHIHPVHNSGRRLGGGDDEISVLDAKQDSELYGSVFNNRSYTAKEGWHTDIPFENVSRQI
jgi:alpha-ketoglutarate-dependent taurine dioxygenase